MGIVKGFPAARHKRACLQLRPGDKKRQLSGRGSVSFFTTTVEHKSLCRVKCRIHVSGVFLGAFFLFFVKAESFFLKGHLFSIAGRNCIPAPTIPVAAALFMQDRRFRLVRGAHLRAQQWCVCFHNLTFEKTCIADNREAIKGAVEQSRRHQIGGLTS